MSRTELEAGDNSGATCPVALLLIDVINAFDFEGAEELVGPAVEMSAALSQLKARAAMCDIPTIYVNDNFGRWRSDFRTLVSYCLEHEPSRQLAARLQPGERDYFILKPKHSGFFATALEVLLKNLDVKTLVMTGLTTHQCVLFTATDAYIRDFHLIVPQDCVASPRENERDAALSQMETVLKTRVCRSEEIDWYELGQVKEDVHPSCPARNSLEPGSETSSRES